MYSELFHHGILYQLHDLSIAIVHLCVANTRTIMDKSFIPTVSVIIYIARGSY